MRMFLVASGQTYYPGEAPDDFDLCTEDLGEAIRTAKNLRKSAYISWVTITMLDTDRPATFVVEKF